jgi:hypothetical protein
MSWQPLAYSYSFHLLYRRLSYIFFLLETLLLLANSQWGIDTCLGYGLSISLCISLSVKAIIFSNDYWSLYMILSTLSQDYIAHIAGYSANWLSLSLLLTDFIHDLPSVRQVDNIRQLPSQDIFSRHSFASPKSFA